MGTGRRSFKTLCHSGFYNEFQNKLTAHRKVEKPITKIAYNFISNLFIKNGRSRFEITIIGRPVNFMRSLFLKMSDMIYQKVLCLFSKEF